MTLAAFEEFVARWALAHPVTMDDLAHIKRELDEVKAAGVPSELVLRGDRVAVTLGMHDARVTRWIEVSS